MRPREELGPEEDRALAAMRGEPVEETCVDCGKPRSIGSGQRCRECYLAGAEAKRQALPDGNKGHVAPVAPHPQQGAAYKPLDLATVEEVMATEETIAKGAARLGLTNMQLYTRRQKDEEVEKAVKRGRDRWYENAPHIDINAEDEDEDPKSAVRTEKPSISEPVIEKPQQIQTDQSPEVRRAKVGENITETITSNENQRTLEKKDPNFPDAKPLTEHELPQKASDPPQIMQKIITPMAQVQVMGGMKFREDVEIRLSELREWPAERISEFFETLSKIIEIPHRPLPTTIKPAWSPSFEGEAGDPESMVGLTYCYLIGMLHHNMEPHEKEAVWTLVQYLKRMEAYVEEKAQHERLNTT